MFRNINLLKITSMVSEPQEQYRKTIVLTRFDGYAASYFSDNTGAITFFNNLPYTPASPIHKMIYLAALKEKNSVTLKKTSNYYDLILSYAKEPKLPMVCGITITPKNDAIEITWNEKSQYSNIRKDITTLLMMVLTNTADQFTEQIIIASHKGEKMCKIPNRDLVARAIFWISKIKGFSETSSIADENFNLKLNFEYEPEAETAFSHLEVYWD